MNTEQNEGATNTPRILVVGPCGAGKSTLVQHAAAELIDVVACDLDAWVSEFTGRNAVELLNRDDPDGCVRACRDAADAFVVSAGKALLVDVGGGAWWAPALLSQWLKAAPYVAVSVQPEIAFERKGRQLFGYYDRFMEAQFSARHQQIMSEASVRIDSSGEVSATKLAFVKAASALLERCHGFSRKGRA